jgi:biopolymer transport protein ExbD
MSLRIRIASTLPRAELNLTPMIDVMLVLLMIFMIVVPALASMVDLPVTNNSDSRPEEPDEIVLIIHRNGTYALEASGVSRQPDDRQLDAELALLYRNRTRDRILYLKADSILPFGAVEQAMQIARRAGVRVVGAVVERKVQPGM